MEKEVGQNKLPKKERREIAKQEKNRAKLLEERKKRRSRNLKVSATAAVIAAVTLGVGALLLPKQENPTESNKPVPSETQPIDYLSIVRAATQGARDQEEFNRWDRIYNLIPNPIPEEDLDNIKFTMISQIAESMRSSKNSYIRDAIEFLDNSGKEHDITISLAPVSGSFAISGINIDTGKLKWVIDIDGNQMIDKGPAETAIWLVHEISHLRSGLALREEFRDLPPQEFYDLYQERSRDIQNRVEEESIAYAAHTTAFLEEQRFIQYPLSNGNDFVVVGANFILCNQDSQSVCWSNYVASDNSFYDPYIR